MWTPTSRWRCLRSSGLWVSLTSGALGRCRSTMRVSSDGTLHNPSPSLLWLHRALLCQALQTSNLCLGVYVTLSIKTGRSSSIASLHVAPQGIESLSQP